jgi:ketosteroid isomerase-like protein
MTHNQAVSVVQQFFAHLEAMDMEAFFALWAADGRQEMPFAPEGFPSELKGKAAIRRQYGGLPAAYGRMVFPGLVLRPLNEPGWVFAEYGGQIELLSGGIYNNRYCGLFHIENGKIVLFREYFNPIILQQSFGNNLGSTFTLPDKA